MKDLIDRYAYAVTHNLPEQQREDIEKELKGLIEDMLEDRLGDREATEKDVEAVLRELGSPAVLADKYRGHARYLIGPQTYPTYLNILKIVFMAVGIAMLVLFAIQSLLSPEQVLDHFVDGLVGWLMASVQAFAWVTAVFSLLDYFGIQKGRLLEETQEWDPADLPSVPEAQTQINPADPIAGIVFTVLFFVLVTYSMPLFGIWTISEGQARVVIPIFDLGVFRGYLPVVWAGLAVGILFEALQLVRRKWTLGLVAFEGLTHAINFGVAYILFSSRAIWNPNFIAQLSATGFFQANSEAYQASSTAWNQVTGGFLYFAGVVLAIQLIITAVKAYKLNHRVSGRFFVK